MSSTASNAWVTSRTRSAAIITRRREMRSATTPPTSRHATSGTVRAASTIPRSVAEPVRSSTAKDRATGTTASPSSDTTCAPNTSRKSRSSSGPRRGRRRIAPLSVRRPTPRGKGEVCVSDRAPGARQGQPGTGGVCVQRPCSRRAARPAGPGRGVRSATVPAASGKARGTPAARPIDDHAAMPRYVGAIDQGTTSTRFLVFDHDGRVVASDQREHAQITPQPGWVEHDPWEIWQATRATMRGDRVGAGAESHRASWRRSESPTSARRRCCGIARSASRANAIVWCAGHPHRRACAPACG